VRVGEELRGVLLNLRNSKTNTSVLAVCLDTSAEWALEAANRVADLVVSDRVREGNSRS
jgi:hypothetical protein